MEQVICSERVILDASASNAFEIFARLQALMCFPLGTKDDRHRIAKGICADLLSQQCELEPELAALLRDSFPEYRKSDNRVSLASHGRKWGEALIAGWYFLVRLDPNFAADGQATAHSSSRPSARVILKQMFPPREDGFEENYESRLHDIEKHLVRRHYRVAHLAAAFQCAAHISAPNGHAGEFEVHNLEFLRALVNLANGYADVIRQTPDFSNVAEQLIELEWRE